MPEFHAENGFSGNGPTPNIFTAMASAHLDGSMDWLEEGSQENAEDAEADEAWMEMVKLIA